MLSKRRRFRSLTRFCLASGFINKRVYRSFCLTMGNEIARTRLINGRDSVRLFRFRVLFSCLHSFLRRFVVRFIWQARNAFLFKLHVNRYRRENCFLANFRRVISTAIRRLNARQFNGVKVYSKYVSFFLILWEVFDHRWSCESVTNTRVLFCSLTGFSAIRSQRRSVASGSIKGSCLYRFPTFFTVLNDSCFVSVYGETPSMFPCINVIFCRRCGKVVFN